jgi:hypothetical protein
MATAAHRARDRGASGGRETAGAYLKAAGIGVQPPGAWGRRPPAKPANESQVTTGSDAAKPIHTINPNPENVSTKEKGQSCTREMGEQVRVDPMISPNTTFQYTFSTFSVAANGNSWRGGGSGGAHSFRGIGLLGSNPRFKLRGGWLILFPTEKPARKFPSHWFSDARETEPYEVPENTLSPLQNGAAYGARRKANRMGFLKAVHDG